MRVSNGFCNSPKPKLASHWLNRDRSTVGSEGRSLADGAGSSVARVPTGPAGSGSACLVIRRVRVRAEMNAGDGRLRFKDDAANFGNSRAQLQGQRFRSKPLLNSVLAIIVRLPAGRDAVAGVVAGPHRIAFSRHNLPSQGRGVQSRKLLRGVSGGARSGPAVQR